MTTPNTNDIIIVHQDNAIYKEATGNAAESAAITKHDESVEEDFENKKRKQIEQLEQSRRNSPPSRP